MPFFSRVFKSKDATTNKIRQQPEKVESGSSTPLRAPWQDPWSRTEVSPNEVQELIHICTQELKSRGKLTSIYICIDIFSDEEPSFSNGHAFRPSTFSTCNTV